MILLEQNYHTGTTTSKVSPETIPEKDRPLEVSDRLANEIKDKGIACHIVREIGSIQFEEIFCYSHLYPMSPRIITNRGYLRLSDIRKSKKHKSRQQTIQRN